MERVEALGSFFAFGVHAPGSADSAPWRPLAQLFGEGSAAFAERVGAVRASLAASGGRAVGEVEQRVAASVAHLGLVSRLVSPVLGCAAVSGRAPALDPQDIRWQSELGGAFPLSLPQDAFTRPADPLAVVDELLRPLEAAPRRMSVSVRILRGNVASAVNGAVQAAAYSGSPDAVRLRAVAGRLLGHPYLAEAFTVGSGQPFRRRSCCLIYRAAAGGAGAVCGDCVLAGRGKSLG